MSECISDILCTACAKFGCMQVSRLSGASVSTRGRYMTKEERQSNPPDGYEHVTMLNDRLSRFLSDLD